jgi:L-erythro-3,5-diaminohexanoate dehydrogenase
MNPFGSHRALDPLGALPQAAWKVDPTLPIQDNEILVAVSTLNIDSASFAQLEEECGHDLERLTRRIQQIVEERGKMHNPVTGSGGMLLGTIAEVGKALRGKPGSHGHTPTPGTRIATLVSLSLTPLHIQQVLGIRPDADQVDVQGHAILFESGLWCPLPDDMPEEVALAALDVAGAAAQVERLVQPGDKVLILGAGGKSGLLCSYQASLRAQTVIGLERHPQSKQELEELGFCHHVIDVDATRPTEVMQALHALGIEEVDLVINCVNLPGTEMSCVLPTRQRGKIYFFSMATSFTAAALGAEGVGKDVDMLIGNGFAKGHDLFTLQILRDCPALKKRFIQRYMPQLLA